MLAFLGCTSAYCIVSLLRILHVLCRGMLLQEGLDFSRIAHLTPGYVGADLMTLTREAAMCAVSRLVGCHMTSQVTVTKPHAHRVMWEALPPQTEVEKQTEASTRHDGSHDDHMTLESIVTQLKEQPPLTQEQLQKVCITSKDFEVSQSTPSASAQPIPMTAVC